MPDLLFLTFPYLCLSRGKHFHYFYVWVPEVKRKALFNKVTKLILYMLGIIAIACSSCVFASLLWFPYLNKQLFCLYHLNMQTENTDCNNSTRGTRSESAVFCPGALIRKQQHVCPVVEMFLSYIKGRHIQLHCPVTKRPIYFKEQQCLQHFSWCALWVLSASVSTSVSDGWEVQHLLYTPSS